MNLFLLIQPSYTTNLRDNDAINVYAEKDKRKINYKGEEVPETLSYLNETLNLCLYDKIEKTETLKSKNETNNLINKHETKSFGSGDIPKSIIASNINRKGVKSFRIEDILADEKNPQCVNFRHLNNDKCLEMNDEHSPKCGNKNSKNQEKINDEKVELFQNVKFHEKHICDAINFKCADLEQSGLSESEKDKGYEINRKSKGVAYLTSMKNEESNAEPLISQDKNTLPITIKRKLKYNQEPEKILITPHLIFHDNVSDHNKIDFIGNSDDYGPPQKFKVVYESYKQGQLKTIMKVDNRDIRHGNANFNNSNNIDSKEKLNQSCEESQVKSDLFSKNLSENEIPNIRNYISPIKETYFFHKEDISYVNHPNTSEEKSNPPVIHKNSNNIHNNAIGCSNDRIKEISKSETRSESIPSPCHKREDVVENIKSKQKWTFSKNKTLSMFMEINSIIKTHLEKIFPQFKFQGILDTIYADVSLFGWDINRKTRFKKQPFRLVLDKEYSFNDFIKKVGGENPDNTLRKAKKQYEIFLNTRNCSSKRKTDTPWKVIQDNTLNNNKSNFYNTTKKIVNKINAKQGYANEIMTPADKFIIYYVENSVSDLLENLSKDHYISTFFPELQIINELYKSNKDKMWLFRRKWHAGIFLKTFVEQKLKFFKMEFPEDQKQKKIPDLSKGILEIRTFFISEFLKFLNVTKPHVAGYILLSLRIHNLHENGRFDYDFEKEQYYKLFSMCVAWLVKFIKTKSIDENLEIVEIFEF